MKYFINRTVLILVICAMAGITALATTTTRKVTFNNPVIVNGTLVKAGTYKITFNDKTGMFTILDGKKVVVQATARSEKIDGRNQSSYSTRINGVNKDLVSITMTSNRQAVIVNDGGNMKETTP